MGTLFWICLLYWVAIFSVAGFVALILYLAGYFVLFLLGLELFCKRASFPIWFVAPPLWVVLEHLRAVGELGFPWGQLGSSLTYHPLLLQMSDITGPYGVSLWIVLVNALIYHALISFRGRAKFLSALMLVILLPLAYGLFCYQRKDLLEGDPLTLSLVQPNIDQDQKWSPVYRDTTFQILEALSRDTLLDRPDLIVWPETAVPAFIRHHGVYRRRVSRMAESFGVPLLVGSQDFDRIGERDYLTYNSAFLFHEDGLMDDRRYSKIRLVPFGEKLPYEDLFPALRRIEYQGGHFSAGDEFTLFDVDQGNFGVLICFESIFPDLSREFCRRGANFLLNITNDAWFLRTSAPYQHASALAMRAIENRVWIGRSGNTGITMIVDPLGRIVARTPIFTQAVLSGGIRARTPDSFYLRHGDFVAYGSWGLVGLAAIAHRRTRRYR